MDGCRIDDQQKVFYEAKGITNWAMDNRMIIGVFVGVSGTYEYPASKAAHAHMYNAVLSS
jgi:hypothetical protein